MERSAAADFQALLEDGEESVCGRAVEHDLADGLDGEVFDAGGFDGWGGGCHDELFDFGHGWDL